MLRTKATTTNARRRPVGYWESVSSGLPSRSGVISPPFSFSDILCSLLTIEGVRDSEGSEPAGDARVVALDAIAKYSKVWLDVKARGRVGGVKGDQAFWKL